MSTYTIPYVVQQTPRGERTVDLYSRLLADRIIYLGTEIDDGVANAVIAQMLHLASENPELPISLYLNSPGGSITAMLAVYDAMQFVKPPVETVCVGQAAWTAAVLLAGGAPGRRAILPHGRVVLHQPATQGRGTIPDLILEADEVARVRLLLEEVLAQHTGRTAEQIRQDTDRTLVLPGEAAVDYGLVDVVLREQGPALARAAVPGQAARASASGRPARTASRRTLRSRAPAMACSISEDGSLSPRSTSERYCTDTPARSATSLSRSPRAARSRWSSSPTISRHRRSGAGGASDGCTGNRTTSPMPSNVATSPVSWHGVLLTAE